MKLNELGEFGFIDLIKRQVSAPEGVMGIGDDCAILPPTTEQTLLTTDMLIEGIHFLRHEATPRQVGWRSAAVNISDLAAMGSRPLATLLSIALPADVEAEWAEEFVEGYRQVCDRYGAPLIGGDTTSAPKDIAINVVAIGTAAPLAPLLRSGARVGDTIFVSGPLGDSGAGLKAILEHTERAEAVERLIERHHCPIPHVEQGIAIAASGRAHAMMDISDGLASDLRHILRASGVAAEVDFALLPLSAELQEVAAAQGWDTDSLAVSAGEDFVLLVTGTEDLADRVPYPLYPIGHIVAGKPEIHWLRDGHPTEYDKIGFTHF